MTICEVIISPTLRDCFLLAQKHYEKELTGWLVSHPSDVLQLCGDWTPEVALVEKEFWQSVKRLDLNCSEESQIKLVYDLANTHDLFTEYMRWLCSVNSYSSYIDQVRLLLTKIKVLHDGRVAIELIQDHPSLLQGVFDGR